MSLSTPIDKQTTDPPATISLYASPLHARARQRRLNLKTSVRKVHDECQQIRSEWSCEEEGRRKRMADVMQVRLLDVLTA